MVCPAASPVTFSPGAVPPRVAMVGSATAKVTGASSGVMATLKPIGVAPSSGMVRVSGV